MWYKCCGHGIGLEAPAQAGDAERRNMGEENAGRSQQYAPGSSDAERPSLGEGNADAFRDELDDDEDALGSDAEIIGAILGGVDITGGQLAHHVCLRFDL